MWHIKNFLMIFIIILLLTIGTTVVKAEDLPEIIENRITEMRRENSSPEKENPGDEQPALTLDDCIKTALNKHPEIKSSIALRKTSDARVRQTLSYYYPTITLSSTYNRSVSKNVKYEGIDLFDNTQKIKTDSYGTSFNLSQNIYDFGRTRYRVTAARENLDMSKYEVLAVADNVIYQIREAYFKTVASDKALDIAKFALEQRELQLKYARNFFEIGRRAKIEVTQAEVDVANAQLDVIKAENRLKIARIDLAKAIGIDEEIDQKLDDQIRIDEIDLNLERAVEFAYQHRPEILKMDAGQRERSALVDLARSQYYPQLRGSAVYGYSDNTFVFKNNRWGWGVSLNYDIFTSGYRSGEVDATLSNLEAYRENRHRLMQNISAEVKNSYLSLLEAEKRINVLEKSLETARENYRLARGRYEAGLSTNLEFSDAQLSLQTAENNLVAAILDYQIARAALEKATGMTVLSQNLIEILLK